MVDIAKLRVRRNASLKQSLSQLDLAAQGILLMVNEEGSLERTVTDGDIRRLLLHGHSLDTKLSVLPAQKPTVLPENASAEDAYTLMQELDLDHIPVVDHEYKPLRLVHRRDISPSILLSTPHLGDYEQEYVQEAFRTNWIAPLGPNVDAFEKEMAAYIGLPSAAALSSGTAAIHLALVLLDVKPGDVVFCQSFTFVASANPILYQGATPVFIDSDLETWNMSPQALALALEEADKQGRLPKAVIVVNLYGQTADYDALKFLCDRYEVPIIEDAAESLGATYKGRASGTLGKIGIYSFNGNKIITTSGGGMLVSEDPALVQKARFLSTQSREAMPHYEHTSIGYNYRMSNVLAGIGRGQLRVLGERIKMRRAVYHQYLRALADFPEISMMPETSLGLSTHWLSTMVLNPKLTPIRPSQLINQLKQRSIEARHTWKPMHRQPLFCGAKYYSHAPDFSVSDYLFEHGVCLPSGSNMKDIDLQRVIENMVSMIKNNVIKV